MAEVRKEEDIKKAIDGLVDAALSTPVETKTEVVEKAAPEEKEMAEDKDADDKAPAKDGDDAKKKKKDDKKPAFLKKSIEELSSVLSEDEVELIKAWREENGEIEVEEVAVAPQINVEEITKSFRASISAEFETLKKSLTEKDSLIKGLSDKVETLSKQPAYDKRSLATLEPIEKSVDEAPIQKSQVLNKMLELQASGKGVRSQHVAEFETTGNISDPGIKALVMNSFKS